MSEFARMMLAPICPKCGNPAMFEKKAATVDEIIGVKCDRCGWEGVSRESVPQPSGAPDA